MEKMQPEFDDEEAINPFDLWSGANFRLKVRKVAGFVNYDKSEFEDSSAILDGDDAKMEELWKTQYPLKEFVDESNFKSYDELKTRMISVLGRGAGTTSVEDVEESHFEDNSKPNPFDKVGTGSTNQTNSDEGSDAVEDDALSYFEKLANEG
jgi:hypothetical protein